MTRSKFKLPTLRASQWDPWLQRASHIAQVVLVVVALLTIYFTVVPLYRLAALDKQIFDQQQELARIDGELAEAYARLRTGIARDAIFAAGPQCTGLMDPPESPASAKRLADAIEGRPTEPEPPPSWERKLTMDARSCILEAVAALPGLGQLRVEDKTALMSELRTVADAVARDQQKSLARARSLPELARKDESVLLPEGDNEVVMRYRNRHLPEAELEQRVLEQRIDFARFQIAMEWADRTRDALLQVIKMRWPE